MPKTAEQILARVAPLAREFANAVIDEGPGACMVNFDHGFVAFAADTAAGSTEARAAMARMLASDPHAQRTGAMPPSETTEAMIARVCYEVNRAYCQSLGDQSQPPWAEAAEWQKASVFKGVQLHRANPETGPAASHEAWVAEKVAAGWTYGPVKDPAAKQHPCIVPFDQLPREQHAKDFIFRAVVHALSTPKPS